MVLFFSSPADLVFSLDSCTTCAQRGQPCYLKPQFAVCQFCKAHKTKCSKAPGRLLTHPRVVIRPLMDVYVLSEHEMETETDISEPSSKIVWMSEWAAGVAQAIQDHANAMREVSRQYPGQGKSAAQATVMAAVIKMGSDLRDFKEWVKALEGGEDDEEDKEDLKGKKRVTGENKLEDMRERHCKRKRVEDKVLAAEEDELTAVEPLVRQPSAGLEEPSEEIGEPSGSKLKKTKWCVVESLGEEESKKEEESEKSEAGDYKVKERGGREKLGTAESSDD